MRTPLALRNVLHDKRRTLAATCGVAFAILLVFIQLGFYTACRTSALVDEGGSGEPTRISTGYGSWRGREDSSRPR